MAIRQMGIGALSAMWLMVQSHLKSGRKMAEFHPHYQLPIFTTF